MSTSVFRYNLNWKKISIVMLLIAGIGIPLALFGGTSIGANTINNNIDCNPTTLNLRIDNYFYIIDLLEDPEYKNRTANIVGMEMSFMLFDYDGFESILNYMNEDNCINMTDTEEINEITGMNNFISGFSYMVWSGGMSFFDETLSDLRGSTKSIKLNFYLIPFFVVYFELNGDVESVEFTFEDISLFIDAMEEEEGIICKEDVEGVHFLHGCENNFVFKGLEWDSIDEENSTALISFNNQNFEMLHTDSILF